jgi:hypothetical protein
MRGGDDEDDERIGQLSQTGGRQEGKKEASGSDFRGFTHPNRPNPWGGNGPNCNQISPAIRKKNKVKK